MPDSSVVATGEPDERRPPGRNTLKLLVGPVIALVVISNLGDALLPKLVDEHPLLLLAMNARNRNLIAVTNSLDAVSYYVVGTSRLLLSDPLFFLIGLWYGDTALSWMERRTKSYGAMLRSMEGWFGRAAYPLVFIMPNNFICLFAGASGMSVGGFFTANLTGTIARLFLIRRLGEQFEAPIDDVLGFIADHRGPLLAISVVLFAVVMISELRTSRAGFDELADAVEHDDEQTDAAEEADP
jgi:membrane protein DedA with SNARE-associated domain